MITEDTHKCHLYVVNGIICGFIDYFRSYPTIQDVRNNWQFAYSECHDVTDEEIEKIISDVKRIDNY